MNTHAVLCLDVDAPIAEGDILPLLPPIRREFRLLRLSDFGGPTPKGLRPSSNFMEWGGLANAVTRLAGEARTLRSTSAALVEFFIVGRAPLPLFTLLGAEMSAWAKPQTFLNQRKDGTWDILKLDETKHGETRYFDHLSGLNNEISEANGLVGVFISTQAALPRDAVRTFLTNHGTGIAGIVECRNSATIPVDAFNASAIAEEIARVFAETRRVYPNHSGLALFIAGPASLAFMVGRAFNPRAMGRAWVANFSPPGYELAFTLPWLPITRMEVRQGEEHDQARQEILRTLLEATQHLKDTLQADDLPPILRPRERDGFLNRLRNLTIVRSPEGDETRLSVGQRRLTFGRGLLEGLRRLDKSRWAPLAQQFLLHELFHFDQELTSQNYRGVGRGGFALEEVDYWADTLAVCTIANWRIREEGAQVECDPAQVLTEVIETSLWGIETFDRMECGDLIQELLERRLRRYLIWALQLARARTLRTNAQVWEMLGERLFVELAPLRKRFDNQQDTLIAEAPPEAELFVVYRSRLMRLHRRPGFEPASLVEVVRRFDRTVLFSMMDFVAEQEHSILTPWVE